MQSPNDFDRIANMRVRSEILFSIGDINAAEHEALTGLALAQRHSAVRDAFSLQVILVEINARRGSADKLKFFLHDALEGMEGDYALHRRDRISCLFHSVTALGREDLLPRLRELWKEELEWLDPVRGRDSLLKLRRFGELADFLDGQETGA